VHWASGIPHALLGRELNARLGRIAPRGREVVSGLFLLFENFEGGVGAKRALTSRVKCTRHART
jgi:hypothetical protein